MLKAEFKDVKIIVNTQNLGFSKANNQGIAQAKGKFVLLLNPDTLVYKNTFGLFKFSIQTNNCGGIGVQMLDPNNQF